MQIKTIIRNVGLGREKLRLKLKLNLTFKTDKSELNHNYFVATCTLPEYTPL